MKNLKWNMVGWVVVVMSVVSCGYQFEGGGLIKDTVTQVAVDAFENKSSETGAGMAFTNALIQEIIQKTDTRVVDETRATAVFTGTVKAITFTTLSRSSSESVIERRVSAIVDLKLVNKADKEVIWSIKDFTSYEDYPVSSNQITDDGNKRDAVNKIAARSAEKLLGKIMVNF
jgi:hypothetical protein